MSARVPPPKFQKRRQWKGTKSGLYGW